MEIVWYILLWWPACNCPSHPPPVAGLLAQPASGVAVSFLVLPLGSRTCGRRLVELGEHLRRRGHICNVFGALAASAATTGRVVAFLPGLGRD